MGFHGVCRPTIGGALTFLGHVYPFAWLGIFALTHPWSKELVYGSHDNGLALHSIRSPEVTRQYLQVPQHRRGRLVAQRRDDGYQFDIRLQGDDETVFFDV
jgi:hypothetical protein